MKKKIKILVIDDEAIIRESLRDWLGDVGHQVLTAENGYQALEIIEREKPGIAIVDLVMPGMDGIELLKRAKEISPTIEVIIITAYGSVPTAITAMREGAYDYIEKPFCPEKAELLIEKLAEHRQLVEDNISLRQQLEERYRFENIIAKSPKMQQIIEVIKVVAKSSATVLITGDSGTGKELVARAIHSQSYRNDGPFVAVSCAALPESLLESELFGHEKGAFTGAHAQRKGKFEVANKGTLFLDEIGEMSANIQVHLLRVLEEKEFTRVGGNELIKVDVRVISATNKDLKKAVASRQFREDLYYRLNVVSIDLPPLRERKEDIQLLAQHFLGKFALENEGKNFLDEVADMSLKAQAKVLRILQEKKFERVGGNKLIPTDVRVLAATNKDLEKEMEEGRFRQDLYYRLNVIPLRIPPLRDRKEDIPLLADRFIKDFAVKEGEPEKQITDEVIAVLMKHNWPGNVRELKNIIERLVIMTPSSVISKCDLSPLFEDVKVETLPLEADITADTFREAKQDFERQYIIRKLREFDGNISRTAEAIGLERSNLHKKIRSYGLEAKGDS